MDGDCLEGAAGGGRGGEAEQEAKGLPYFLAVMGQKGACEGEN